VAGLAAGWSGLARAQGQPPEGDPFEAPAGADGGRPVPGATTTTAPPPVGTASTPASAAPATQPVLLAGCDHLSRLVCERANTGILATSGGYAVASALLFSLLRVWLARRGANRFLPLLVLSAALAGGLSVMDPAAAHDLRCCLASPVFRGELLLSGSVPGRAALVGLAGLVLYTLAWLGEKLVRR
jgi:hypothetical protein